MAAGVAVAVLLLAGCDPSAGGGGGQAKPRPTAGGQQRPGLAGGGTAPAPVRGDPSAHNTQPGEVDLHVEWVSENRTTPVCEWSKNGVATPCTNMERPEREGGEYIGLWEYGDHGKAGDRYAINAQGFAGTKDIRCSISWKGAYHAGVTNGRRCSIDLVLQ